VTVGVVRAGEVLGLESFIDRDGDDGCEFTICWRTATAPVPTVAATATTATPLTTAETATVLPVPAASAAMPPVPPVPVPPAETE